MTGNGQKSIFWPLRPPPFEKKLGKKLLIQLLFQNFLELSECEKNGKKIFFPFTPPPLDPDPHDNFCSGVNPDPQHWVCRIKLTKQVNLLNENQFTKNKQISTFNHSVIIALLTCIVRRIPNLSQNCKESQCRSVRLQVCTILCNVYKIVHVYNSRIPEKQRRLFHQY